MNSKEDALYELFFDYPTKEWHFEEILKHAKIARSKADHWLKKFIKEGIIKKVKEKGKMPYYIAEHQLSSYRNRKKLFAYQKLYTSGFLNHLGSLEKAKTVIFFGSFSRSDWYKESDIDVFIYGDCEGLRILPYELRLHRDIEIFVCNTSQELHKFGASFLRNIIKGTLIKGTLDFIEVKIKCQHFFPRVMHS